MNRGEHGRVTQGMRPPADGAALLVFTEDGRLHTLALPAHTVTLVRRLAESEAVTMPAMPAIAAIRAATAYYFGVPEAVLVSNLATAEACDRRGVAILLAARLTVHSVSALGKHFGGRDPSTILMALRRAERRESEDERLLAARETIAARLLGDLAGLAEAAE